MNRIKIPHKFNNSKGEDDKKPIFESLGCDVKDHSQGILVNNYFVVSLASNRWRAIDAAKWYPYKNIKDLVENYITKHGDPIRKAKVTKAIIYRFGWVRLEARHYIKDNISLKRYEDAQGFPTQFYAETNDGYFHIQTVGELMDLYKQQTDRDLVFPDYEYVRGYIEKQGNLN